MCGICGLTAPLAEETLRRMVATIVHRGPDDSGVYVAPDGAVGLGSTRLSIIDLSPAGHMPMLSDDGSVALAYNGEVYNFRELRRELEALGFSFRSRTDTEVVLRAYEAWGEDMFARLNGMFALALWDARERRLLLARDRFGIKPLYYHRGADGRLLFASEVKALPPAGYRPGALDPEALHRYLTFLWVPGPATLFTGVRKLEPGHWAEWRDGAFAVHPFWRPRFEPRRGSAAAAAAHLRERLEAAVDRQLVADVPVGVFLSGGLDSTVLTSLAARSTTGPVRCYTIAFRAADASLEQSSADARYARVAAEYCGAELHEIEVDPDVVSLLPKVVRHLDVPIADPAAINTYLISEAARRDVTVLLSGQGADEVFAGYRVQAMPAVAERLRLLPRPVRERLLGPAVGALPALSRHAVGVSPGLVLAAHRYFTRMLPGVDMPFEERYVRYRSFYTDAELLGLYSPDLRDSLRDAASGSEHLEYFAEVPGEAPLDRILYVDWKTFLPELNLAYGDKMSMAASVETRVPFLDNEVVDFMLTVPADLKVRGLVSKYLLRRAVKDIVPASILRRRKAGFGAPIRAWLRGDLRGMVDDLLGAERVRRRGYFDPAAVRRLVDDDREGRADNTYRIWALLTLELWHQESVDGAGA